MRYFLVRLLISAFSLWVADKIVPGFNLDSVATLVIAAVLMGAINAVVRPVLVLLTLPITILSLGLFLLVINAAMLALVAWILPGFTISGFPAALFGWLIISITGWAVSQLIQG